MTGVYCVDPDLKIQAICEKEDETLKASSEKLILHLASLHGAIEISEKYGTFFLFAFIIVLFIFISEANRS